MGRILVADPIAREGIDRLRAHAEVDIATGLGHGQLVERIGAYDALVVRSETKVTADVIDAGRDLKIIGRAGVGVDNIDVEAATARGILVVNSPGGNTIAATEQTIALLLAMSRNIAQANASLHAGKWERSSFVGVEVLNKTLGVVGLGRIGSEVAQRAQGLMMNVIGYDPFLSAEAARKRGVELLALDDVLRQADFVTIHVPLTAETRHVIGAREIGLMKPGARLLNVARGGLVDEVALCEALESGHLAGAALDVFEIEPLPPDSPLLSLPNVIVTPHLGASTKEAQVNVAIEVADEILAALRGDAVPSAVNLPPVPREVYRQMRPHLNLAEKMGLLLGQLVDGAAERLEIHYGGAVAEMQTSLLTLAATKGFLAPQLSEPVNEVNAQIIARRRGIECLEEKTSSSEGFASLITARVVTRTGTWAVSGSLFGQEPRIVNIDGYRVDFEPYGYMLIDKHVDRPGVVGKIGTILGNNSINIGGMQLGRVSPGGIAVAVVSIDGIVSPEVMAIIRQVDGIENLRLVNLGAKK